MLRLEGRTERKMSTEEASQFRDDVLRGADWVQGVVGEADRVLDGVPYHVTLLRCYPGPRSATSMKVSLGAGMTPFAELLVRHDGGSMVSADGTSDGCPGMWDAFVDRMGW